jgi:DNA-binding FrmR family transcriptional regulator
MKKDCCPTDALAKHPSHHDELPRLNRVAGQVEGIKKMIETGRYCPDILTQLRAVRAALRTIEASVLDRHLGSCVKEAMRSGNKAAQDKKVAEIISLFKSYAD